MAGVLPLVLALFVRGRLSFDGRSSRPIHSSAKVLAQANDRDATTKHVRHHSSTYIRVRCLTHPLRTQQNDFSMVGVQRKPSSRAKSEVVFSSNLPTHRNYPLSGAFGKLQIHRRITRLLRTMICSTYFAYFLSTAKHCHGAGRYSPTRPRQGKQARSRGGRTPGLCGWSGAQEAADAHSPTTGQPNTALYPRYNSVMYPCIHVCVCMCVCVCLNSRISS